MSVFTPLMNHAGLFESSNAAGGQTSSPQSRVFHFSGVHGFISALVCREEPLNRTRRVQHLHSLISVFYFHGLNLMSRNISYHYSA